MPSIMYYLVNVNDGAAISNSLTSAQAYFVMCLMGTHSFTRHRHILYTYANFNSSHPLFTKFAQSCNIHLFAITETWITLSATSAELINATPPGFTLISCPRPASATLTKSHIVGGDTAFLVREPATLFSTPTHSLKSFKCHLSLLNSSVSSLLSPMSIVLLQLP